MLHPKLFEESQSASISPNLLREFLRIQVADSIEIPPFVTIMYIHAF